MTTSISASASPIARWRAALSETALGSRLALALWVVWAFCVWNVIFDRVLVLAGRRYVYTAAMAARDSNAYVKIDEWMRPAIVQGAWMATLPAVAIVAAGIVSVRFAATRRTFISSESLRRN